MFRQPMPPFVAPSRLDSPATVDIVFLYRDFVDILENVSVSAPVTTLRNQLCKQLKDNFNIDVSPEGIRLKTLLNVNGEWPAEGDTKHAESRPTTISNLVGTEFEGAGAECTCWLSYLRMRTREILH
ncbi:hypothetical protein V7S43_016963 [Phytophthora oleae]|uniref:Uncharacterized protein n=1 Tax=Phytophthora oleae TaxID=2107226 RepID=A0ABD3EYH6_9STRA